MVTSQSLCEDVRANIIRSLARKINAAPGKTYVQVGAEACSAYAINGCINNSSDNEYFVFVLKYYDTKSGKNLSWEAALLDIDIVDDYFGYTLVAANLPVLMIFTDKD